MTEDERILLEKIEQCKKMNNYLEVKKLEKTLEIYRKYFKKGK